MKQNSLFHLLFCFYLYSFGELCYYNVIWLECIFFVFQDCIPTLVKILKSNQVTQSTIMLFTAVLQALTNLTTLNQSHQSILPYVNVLCELLDQCDVVQIKVWF